MSIASIALAGGWTQLPPELRAIVRRLLGVRNRARLSRTCWLNRREDTPTLPGWCVFGDKLQSVALRRALWELIDTGLFDALVEGRLFTTQEKVNITVSNGNYLLAIASTGPDHTPISLDAAPQYRPGGPKWITNLFGTGCQKRDKLARDGSVSYVLDHIDWSFEWQDGSMNARLFGPYSSLRDFVAGIHPWTPVAQWFTFSATSATKYKSYRARLER